VIQRPRIGARAGSRAGRQWKRLALMRQIRRVRREGTGRLAPAS
jgi:hypothetical protein